MIKVFDDVLSSEEFTTINNILNPEESGSFPWYWCKILAKGEEMGDPLRNWFFYHMYYDNHGWVSNEASLLEPLLNKMVVRSLIRIKANIYPATEKIHRQGFHVDNAYQDALTAIYYVNSNNGYTEFEDGTRIDSIANSLIIFPSSMKHSGTSTTDTNCRVNINFNYF